MSTALVEMFNNQPMTTSLAIAEGTQNTHKQVIAMVRKYIEDLQEFGTSAFETRKSGGRYTEVALLNEQQATLLITYLKNTEIVRKFKIALVKAFYEMRDRLAQATPHTNNPLTLSHRADIRVAADRTFRSVLRASRSAGSKLPNALQRANEITLRETGIDMLSELQIDTNQHKGYAVYESHLQFFDSWMKNELPVPCAPCRSQHLYMAYQQWEKLQGGFIQPINKVLADVVRHCGFVKSKFRYGKGAENICTVVMPTGQWFKQRQTVELEQYLMEFKSSLDDWVNQKA